MDIVMHEQLSDKGKCWWAPEVDTAGTLAAGAYWQGGEQYPYAATNLSGMAEGDRLFGRPDPAAPLLAVAAGAQTDEAKLLAWVEDGALHLVTHRPAQA